MALPKIDSPVFHVTVPVVNSTITMRPYKMKEEKILLLAQQSESPAQMVLAMKQVINNCVVDGDINIDALPNFAIEYILLQLRKQSVGSTVKLKFEDNEDQREYEFEIDLEEVGIVEDPNHTDSIELTSNIGLLMRYPSLDITAVLAENNDELEQSIAAIKYCIDKVFTDEEVIEFQTHTDAEMNEFLDQFTQEQMQKLIDFFTTMPALKHTIHYENSNGNSRKIELTGVADFFT